MTSIGTVLRDEIFRLSRRATRSDIDPTRKATAKHRRDIAALKRKVAQLERQVTSVTRKLSAEPAARAADASGTSRRFVAKGLISHRKRLGLSAGDFGKLLGVSPQTVYNWEQGVTRPRNEQLARLAAVRTIGKREAAQQLSRLSSKSENRRAKA